MDAREVIAKTLRSIYAGDLESWTDAGFREDADEIVAALAANQLAVVDTTLFDPVCRNCAGCHEIYDGKGTAIKCPVCSPSPLSTGE